LGFFSKKRFLKSCFYRANFFEGSRKHAFTKNNIKEMTILQNMSFFERCVYKIWNKQRGECGKLCFA
jgi:hypothetical protein